MLGKENKANEVNLVEFNPNNFLILDFGVLLSLGFPSHVMPILINPERNWLMNLLPHKGKK